MYGQQLCKVGSRYVWWYRQKLFVEIVLFKSSWIKYFNGMRLFDVILSIFDRFNFGGVETNHQLQFHANFSSYMISSYIQYHNYFL